MPPCTAPRVAGPAPGAPPKLRWVCDTLCQGCDIVTQGQPWFWRALQRLALWLLAMAVPSMAAAACAGPELRLLPLAPGLWWVRAAPGESDHLNRGQVSNTVLVREGRGRTARLWALGSGPSPAWGRALACQARARLGLPITDVISPWARPELVLGVAGLQQQGPLRHWAHASVAQAMAEQCPHCVERLRQRLQAAASDLGDDPIRVPELLLQGEQGRLGPFDWWRLPRAEGRWITVWRVRAAGATQGPLWVAHGLLQGDGPPDGRDADLALLLQASQRLAALAAVDGPAVRFIGEQGPVMGAGAPARHAVYWSSLLDEARAAVARGDDETAPAPAWPGLPPSWQAHPWHGFNWQRAWRQVEPEVLAAPPR